MPYGGIFDYEVKYERLEEVVKELEDPSIWNDPENAQKLGKERANLELVVIGLRDLTASIQDAKEIFELASLENDTSMLHEVNQDVLKIEQVVIKLEFKKMFSGKMDTCNAFLDIQSGSGGTEAQDWAMMMMRMYLRMCEQHGFIVEVVECSSGDVAGIKSATIYVQGENAFGWLRTETGVHRLVRKSPFDS